jgi:hypothetical protein
MKAYYIRTPVHYCGGKVVYDKRGAMTAKNAREKEGAGELRIYPCPRGCRGWHLTRRV